MARGNDRYYRQRKRKGVSPMSEYKFQYIDENILKYYFQILENLNEKPNKGSGTSSFHFKIDDQQIIVYKNGDDGTTTIVFTKGKEGNPLFNELQLLDKKIAEKNIPIFIVYGHGDNGIHRDCLQTILQKWNFKPIYLDQQVNSGMTIIEKLENYMKEAKMGIVLGTPDDIGHANNSEGRLKPRYRMRQNVVLEMGMIMGQKERKELILLSQNDRERPIEFPGDIDGIVRVQFEKTVQESKGGLMQELFKLYEINRSDIKEELKENNHVK